MKLRIALCLAALATAGSVQAQDQAPPPDASARQAAAAAVLKACDADVKSMCSDKQGREVFACLRQNSDKVSGDCKTSLAKLPSRRPPAAPAPQ